MLEISEVLIPRSAGGLCAFGMAVTPVRHDYVRLHHCYTNESGVAPDIAQVFDELIAEGGKHLEEEGFKPEEIRFARHIEGRYPGQVHNLTVPLPEGPINDDLLHQLEANFHDEHERRFTYAMRDQPIESLHWRIAATGNRPAPEGRLAQQPTEILKARSTRMAYMASVNAEVETEVYQGDALAAGDQLTGPAIVEFATTTVVVNPEDKLTVQADGSSLLTIAI